MATRRKFGTIDKLKSGKFRARYRLDEGWRNAPETFATISKAEAWLAEREETVLSSIISAETVNCDSTFNQVADVFLKMPRKRRKKTDEGTTSKKSGRTTRTYESVLRLHVCPFFGEMRVADIDLKTVLDYQAWIEEKLEGHPVTMARAQDYARWVLNLAVALGALRLNPYAHPRVAMPDSSSKRGAVPLEEDDIDTMERLIHPHFRNVIRFTAYTGLRAGEVWALRRRSVNVLKKELYVTASVNEEKGKGLTMSTTKNGKSRTIALPDQIVNLLVEQMADHSGGPDDWLFPSIKGMQMRHTNFMEDFFKPMRNSLDQAGDRIFSERLRFHDLRHFCAHYHISHGFNEYRIMDLLGHSSIQVTMDIYGGLFSSARRAMADRVSELMAERAVELEVAPVVPREASVSSSKSVVYPEKFHGSSTKTGTDSR